MTIRHLGTDDDIALEQDDAELLFSADDRIRFGRRWRDIQSRFVDDPVIPWSRPTIQRYRALFHRLLSA